MTKLRQKELLESLASPLSTLDVQAIVIKPELLSDDSKALSTATIGAVGTCIVPLGYKDVEDIIEMNGLGNLVTGANLETLKELKAFESKLKFGGPFVSNGGCASRFIQIALLGLREEAEIAA